MAFLSWLLIATALLMLSGVDMEHLHAENLNLLHPHEHNLVLNGGFTGTYVYIGFHFQFTVSVMKTLFVQREL